MGATSADHFHDSIFIPAAYPRDARDGGRSCGRAAGRSSLDHHAGSTQNGTRLFTAHTIGCGSSKAPAPRDIGTPLAGPAVCPRKPFLLRAAPPVKNQAFDIHLAIRSAPIGPFHTHSCASRANSRGWLAQHFPVLPRCIAYSLSRSGVRRAAALHHGVEL